MRLSSIAAALSALPIATQAVYQGFSYGSRAANKSCISYDDYVAMFNTAKNLAEGGFTSARLYTGVQCGTVKTPSAAFDAAINTGTQLLLGLWASSGQSRINNEIAILQQVADKYGTQFSDLVQGISVGSEDLYRHSSVGKAAKAGPGASATKIVKYISQVRKAIKGTVLENVPVGHVDTAWTLPGNDIVIDAVDWIGDNEFPYFETGNSNAIGSAKGLFTGGVSAVQKIANGKPIWITETGWPTKGPVSNLAIASKTNAQTYYDTVGCGLLFGKKNTWWYTLYDENVAQTDISYAIVHGAGAPVFDLTCPT